MSLTLKTASAVTVALTLAQRLANGSIFQKVGASFLDVMKLTLTQNTNSDNTSKTRVVMKVPYSYTLGTTTYNDFVNWSIEVSIKETCPQTIAQQIPWLIQSYAADASFNDLIANRANTAA